MFEDARLIGQTAYIFELGSRARRRRRAGVAHRRAGADRRGRHDPRPDRGDRARPRCCSTHYAGRLEYHTPWHTNRDVSHLFRGLVDARARPTRCWREPASAGCASSTTASCARAPPISPRCRSCTPTTSSRARPRRRAPSPATCRSADTRAEECIAVGDSREDLDAAAAVGSFWLVANALDKDPTLREAIAGRANVRIADATYGAGVYEAVVTTLAERT